MHREGTLYPRTPTDSTDGNKPSTDQCIFLKHCELKWHGVFKKIVAGVGYHQLPENKHGGSTAGGGGVTVAQEEEEGKGLSLYFESEMSYLIHYITH